MLLFRKRVKVFRAYRRAIREAKILPKGLWLHKECPACGSRSTVPRISFCDRIACLLENCPEEPFVNLATRTRASCFGHLHLTCSTCQASQPRRANYIAREEVHDESSRQSS